MRLSARNLGILGGVLLLVGIGALSCVRSRPEAGGADELSVARAPRGSVAPTGPGLGDSDPARMTPLAESSDPSSEPPVGAAVPSPDGAAVQVETVRAIEVHDPSDASRPSDSAEASREALAATDISPKPDIRVIAIALGEGRGRVLVERAGETRWTTVPGRAFGYGITEVTMETVLVERDGRTWMLVLGQGRGGGSSTGSGASEGGSGDGGREGPGGDGGEATSAGQGGATPHAHLTAREKAARKSEDIRAINDACWIYENDTGITPTTVGQLMTENGPPGYNGPYLRSANEPRDPFTGKSYVLKDGSVVGPGNVTTYQN